jgi:geranylgeranyl diphosphate synthase type I
MESPELAPTVLKLGQFLESSLLNMLIRGEILDVQFTGCPVLNLARTQILDMLYLKTGALYEYAALAGAAIGLGSTDWEHPWIRGLAQFASRCGTAFQLQDDILGLTGTDEIIGKPVGSDVREGKRTTITYCAYHRANASQRRRLDRILGNRAATPAEVAEAVDLLRDLGGIQETAELARQLTEQAIPLLDAIPESDARELLAEWAQFLIERRF